MRRSTTLLLCLLMALPAGAQQRKLKLDAMGLPPYPGAANVGHIGLPLKDILKPKPGEHPTGPALTDLAIQTYRTPLSVSVDRITTFYLKYAQQLGWKLLDDITDSSTNRSLVFWSPAAPGYLTVEVLTGPQNTRQIDLTRLLGDVNPARSGEVMRLTGKRIRDQHVEVTYVGQFMDLKTRKLVRRKMVAVEDRSEAGLSPAAATQVSPLDETYAVVIRITDTTKHMTSADVYSTNNTLIAHGESKSPTNALAMVGKIRATQGLTVRVVVMGTPEDPTPPVPPQPSPIAVPAPKPPTASTKAAASKAVKTAKPGKTSIVYVKPAKPAAPTKPGPVPVATPPRPPVALTEWYGMRPPLTALVEARRGSFTTKTDTIELEKDVEVGSTCEARQTRPLMWRTEATDTFSFSPDLFGTTLTRSQLGVRTGSTAVDFPLRSGLSNTYTATQLKTITTTAVDLGFAFNSQWVTLPGKKLNPVKTTYTLVATNPPTVTKQSSGACPAK